MAQFLPVKCVLRLAADTDRSGAEGGMAPSALLCEAGDIQSS